MLDYLAMLPVAFPGIVLAVGMLHIWITPPLVLYGPIWILFVAYLTRSLPYGVRSTSATLVQIHPELAASSLSSGAGWVQTFRWVILPLLNPRPTGRAYGKKSWRPKRTTPGEPVQL